MSDADELVARLVLRSYKEQAQGRTSYAHPELPHLATCAEAVVEHPEAWDGAYGETGCPYVTLEATIKCPHGESEDFEYGEFGELAYMIEDMERDAQ